MTRREQGADQHNPGSGEREDLKQRRRGIWRLIHGGA